LAKTIAEFLFNDEHALIRFDMSEYMEKHAAETLLGAPAGYVGYEEGGRLVNSIRQTPYAVLLFDEIEKAHADVYKLFLQILGGGHLTDRLGKKGDFSNAIIIFTSNVCSDWIRERFETGTPPVGHKDQESLRDKLKELRDGQGQAVFLPEFIGRIPNIIPFAPISQEVAFTILDIQINKFRKILSRQHITLEVSDGAKKALVAQGFSPNYGARPLEYIIEEMLGTPVAEMIIAGELEEESTMQADWNEEEGYVWKNITYANASI
jgi:ATP-dependent Clp protease ATP-binding subunit ClpA